MIARTHMKRGEGQRHLHHYHHPFSLARSSEQARPCQQGSAGRDQTVLGLRTSDCRRTDATTGASYPVPGLRDVEIKRVLCSTDAIVPLNAPLLG